jgi:hypothetical protein
MMVRRVAPSPRLHSKSGLPDFEPLLIGRNRKHPISTERVGVKGGFRQIRLAESPLTRPRFASVDLSPQAGRGETHRRIPSCLCDFTHIGKRPWSLVS